jgi:hypothetical protein
MKSNRLLIFVVAFCGLPSLIASKANAATNVLFNGNLDLCQAVEIVPGFFLPKPLGWANVGNRSIAGPYEEEMSSEPWAGPMPTPVTTDGDANPPSPGGCGGPDCGVFFKPFSGNATSGLASGHLYQDNPAMPGLTYLLTGWAGAEANALLEKAEFAVEFLDAASTIIGGSVLDLVGAGLFVDNGQPFDYKQYSVAAIAPANTATVRARISMINAAANPVGGGQAYVVDDFSLMVISHPAISSEPQSRTNNIGTAATFTVGAIGAGPLSYRWRKGNVSLSNGGNISGATTPTLTVASVAPSDATNYSVIVSNSFGSVTSMVATLTVVMSPATDLLFNPHLDFCEAVEIVAGFFLPKPLGWVNAGSRSIAGPYEEELSSEPWAGPAPTPVTTNGNANPPSPGGCGGPDCGVFFKPFSGNTTSGLATGHLYQDNLGRPGVTYRLTGWAGAEANALMGSAEFAIEFLNASSNVIGGSVLDLIAARLFFDNGEPFDYKQQTVIATAPANTVTVRVRASMIDASANPAGGGQAFVVDDFDLSVLPSVRPEFTSITVLSPGGAKQITAQGEANRFYIVEATGSLAAPVSWSNLGGTNANGSGVIQFVDDAAGFTERFYRLLVP